MSRPLNVLLVEDQPGDARLIVRELERAGFDPEVRIVDSQDAYVGQLDAELDVILADYDLPDFTGMDALELMQQRALDIPFIIVTGATGEELAVECMKRGASDYLLKDRLARLGPAVAHAQSEKRLREENRQARVALAKNQERLKLALEGTNDGLWDWNIQTDEVYFSPRWETMLGYTPGEVARHADSWREMVHPDDVPGVMAELQAHLAGDMSQYETEHRLRHKDGHWVWVLDRGKVVAWDDAGQPLRAVGTHTDITSRKQFETTLAHLNSVLLAIRNMNQLITKAKSAGELIQSACDILSETRDYYLAWIALLDGERCPTSFAISGAQANAPELAAILGQGVLPYCAQMALSQDRVVITDNPADRCDGCGLSSLYHDSSAATTQLRYADHIYGVLTVSIPRPFAADDREINLFEEIAGDIAYALHNLELEAARRCAEDALRAQRDRAQMYLDVAGVMLVALDTNGDVELINRKGCDILGYAEAEIVGKNWFTYFLPSDRRQQAQGMFSKLIAGENESSGYLESEVLAQSGETRLIGWHNTVLRDGAGQATGTLSSGEDITARRDAEIAQREQHVFASALSEIAAVLNETLDFDTVIQRILDTVGRVMPHDSANIMRIENDHVRVIGHRGYEERGLAEWIEAVRWPLDSVPNLKRQVESGLPDVVPDVQTYEHWRVDAQVTWVRSYANAPIVVDSEVVGFLNLDKGEPNFYNEQHAERLQAFANQASVAIKNAQLYDIVQRYAAELEQRVAERTGELRKSEARYRAIVDDQTELICRYLPDWTVTFANRAYTRYFDVTPQALIGHSFIPFIHEADRADLKRTIRALTPDNPVVDTENRVKTESGEIRWLQWTNRMILNEQDEFIEYQSVGRDITERRKAEEVLRRSLAREMELGEMKSRFVSLVSHEFRNPLAVILMNSDLLHRYHDQLSEAQRSEYMQTIRMHVKGMTDLLEDLLLLSQSEAGKLEIKPERIDLRAFCERIVEEVRTTSGADRQFTFCASEQCEMVTDAKLFRLIASNLISNAAKYSLAESSIEIELTCKTDHLRLRVSDEGIGIPERDQARLFETFHRASNVGKRPGTGLGLTLVKQCVEQLAGTIALHSEEDVGTTVTVTLPRMGDEVLGS